MTLSPAREVVDADRRHTVRGSRLCAPGVVEATSAGQMTWGVQLILERAMFAPIIEPAFLQGVVSRVAFHGLDAVGSFPSSFNYQDLKLKAQ
jgi:hypothetical protein